MNFDQLEGVGLLTGEKENSSWRPLGDPSLPLEPLPLPSALAAQWLLRSGVSGGDWAAAGTAAGSRAQHCHYLTQQEQCWGEGRGAAR